MKNRRRGSAIVETALMMPWIVFLFVGVLDFGFYAYAAICTQNAARAAALAYATASTATPCSAALGELTGLPNMVGVNTCAQYPSSVTATLPAVCVATLSTSGSSDTACSTTASCADCAGPATCAGTCTSAEATVTYKSPQMVPIPGVLTGQLTLTRTAEIRVIQ